MKRMLKNMLLERLLDDDEALPPPASFDDMLSKELREPTQVETSGVGASDIAPSGGLSVDTSPEVMVDSTAQENDRLRAELLPRNRPDAVDTASKRPVFNETGRLTPENMFQQPPVIGAAVPLSTPPAPVSPTLPNPATPALPAAAPQMALPAVAAPTTPVAPAAPMAPSPPPAWMRTDPYEVAPAAPAPAPAQVPAPAPVRAPAVPALSMPQAQLAPSPHAGPSHIDLNNEQNNQYPGGVGIDGGRRSRVAHLPDFWDRYDEAQAAAKLFAVPQAAITVVIGPLEVSVEVAERCIASRRTGKGDVYVLTDRTALPEHPDWTILGRPSDVVQVLESDNSDFPLVVLDIEGELPAWLRPLVARLRQSGVGLVHYVLDDDPSDEDLATWHGELGRPSVLDLAGYVTPERVISLLDRGEPIVSVAGSPISTDLLLALQLGAE